jgi:hypothetical protein
MSPTPHNCRLHINPHIHVLVPGGGIAPDGQSWIACRSGFFLPVQVLSRMLRIPTKPPGYTERDPRTVPI